MFDNDSDQVGFVFSLCPVPVVGDAVCHDGPVFQLAVSPLVIELIPQHGHGQCFLVVVPVEYRPHAPELEHDLLYQVLSAVVISRQLACKAFQLVAHRDDYVVKIFRCHHCYTKVTYESGKCDMRKCFFMEFGMTGKTVMAVTDVGQISGGCFVRKRMPSVSHVAL